LQALVSNPAHLGRLGRERPIQRVTVRADEAPNAKRLTLPSTSDALSNIEIETVEGGDVGVIGAMRPLPDGEHALLKRLNLGVAAI